MNHRDVLREMAERGLCVSLVDGDLRLQGSRDRMDAAFIARVKAAKADLVAHLAQEAEHGPGFPLTPLQRSYYLGRSGIFEIGDVASHVYHEIEGAWDLDRLQTALDTVVGAHSALRSRFLSDDRQITEYGHFLPRIGRLDLRGRSAEEQRRIRAELREHRSHRVLPADEAPLLAVDVTVLAEDKMVLHVGHDGLVMDGISMFLFFRAWWHAYQSGPADTHEELPYEEYLAALETGRTRAPARRSRDYWMDRVEDLAPHPDLPLRTSPAALVRSRFTQRQVRLDRAAWTQLKEQASASGLTPSALLLAAYAEALATWGAGEKFTLTATIANRPPVHPRIFEAIGQFSDTLLVEAEVDRTLPFAERARALQNRLHADIDHRHFSGIEVMQELARRRGGVAGARMPFTFNSAIGHVSSEVDGSALELFGPEVYSVSQTPQVWLNAFAMEQHGALVVQLDGIDELFPEGLLDDLAHGYRTLLGDLVGADAWQRHSFDLLPPAQRERRRAANDTAVPLPAEMLGDAIAARAAATPDAAAILTADRTVSYGELLHRAARAATWLREHGVGRNELVGLVMHRGPEQIIGILATVLAGAAYLPVDASLPAARRDYMLSDGRVRCVLTNTGWAATGSIASYDLTAAPFDGPAEVPAEVPARLTGSDPEDLAYVLYTSGTTGAPKGVMVTHRNVANVVADCHTRFRIRPEDRFFAISAFNFDLSVWDVFGALSAGAALVMPDRDKAVDPAHWLDLCRAHGVSVWNSVPAIVSLLHDQAQADGDVPPALRLVMMSGDRLPPALPAALRTLKPGLEVVSLGGPTETTIWNILHPVREDEDGSESIPYGRPNANNRAYVLDRDGLDAPDWVTGEIVAAGTGLARGYWRDEQRTAERFYEDPARGERLYRTGDLGRYLPDGSISILGRSDFQIKVNGYRIEAGEVETRLAVLDGVAKAVVAARGGQLVAHLVPQGAARPELAELRQALRGDLPDYMIPSVVVWHEALPLTKNAKVDRTKLAALAAEEPDAAPARAAGASAPATEAEKILADIWATVLRRTDIGAQDTLGSLGGDSIAAARILTAARKRFGITITLDQFAEIDTVRAMAAVLAPQETR
ncbi:MULTISPECIES: non-ribosomal peptide synthetase [unclassified Streptomyces]|uniref:non-ribosomal peptide synthetase n=1 Tax=unclassified Streptomyces TaxID=2593676 RepID=UPI001BE76702|nr:MULTISPECIES: non-ribosomal peptide synthetase [unclassified Streptomyces]MBT2402869.1 amino acid adenylation domain-containing protein [Streptomyces sp. ISL-21]MBT2612025.1 amino acid adenylation domain-containing protein [Streptomyces sp. ISL-87]